MQTKIIILCTFACWLVWDFYALQMGQPTESMVIKEWLLQWSFFSVTLGILVGHWGFPTKERKPWMRGDLLVPGIVILAFLALDFSQKAFGAWIPETLRYPGLWIAVGVPLGGLFWNQRK